MKITDTGDLWWKTAVVYCLDIETFRDSDGDGVGDFIGATERLDYLAALGVTCVWLMPFYPSPDRDDGYDVADFFGVDPRLGHHGDVVEFIRTASSRGIRVIVDLVVNHTSDRHPWFVQARRSRRSRYRDYYVWRDRPTRDSANTVFPDEEASVWEWDERTEQYYHHTFRSFQPDLNLGNPQVRDEIAKTIAFWLAMGVSGFRIDAVPFLIAAPGSPDDTDPHEFLRDLKRFTRRRSNDAMLLGEVGLPHKDQLAYFGGSNGGELDAQFDFVMAQSLFLSIVTGDATALHRALTSRPPVYEPVGWMNFLRNHDELSLELLEPGEREAVFEALAPDPRQRVHGRGIVRRLAPMLGDDPRRVRLAFSLLFSLPGSPMLFYGEELGMGEHPEIVGRMAMRTPMQWTPDDGGGFSTARPSRRVAPVVTGSYGPRHVNARDQDKDDGSLLRFVQTLIRCYRSAPEIGWGELTLFDQPARSVLVHALSAPFGTLVAVHNLSPEPAEVSLRPPPAAGYSDMMGREVLEPDADGTLSLALDGYAFRWLRAVDPA